MVQQPSYWKVLTRRKNLEPEGTEGESKLNRVLGLFDLTALGVGSTLGAGVYVLAGQIAKEQAGPSVIISFAIAALASLLAGVCYAEFGARVPKAGSAYVYSYVCIGEFAAFVIGWNLILEYIVGTAGVCRGISLYLDTMINDTLKNTFSDIAPINVSFLGSYFDFFAFGLVVVFGVALAFGVETSTMANNFCTCFNILILLFVIIAGSIKANFANWSVDPTAVEAAPDTPHSSLGNGGFFPFGFAGTLQGAATCFFGFVGFDCIATTGEEVRNPRKNIPRSILLSLLIIFLCYFGVSMVLTLMVPYYAQDPNAPLPYAFEAVGWNFAKWIVSVGGFIALMASLFGALFPLPRIMYSMAEDGLLFRFLGKVSPRYRVPVTGSILAAILTAIIAGIFDLAQLVSLLSIGTLLAYSVVAISVTILRYMDNSEDTDRENANRPLSESSMLTSSGTRVTFRSIMVQLFNFKRIDTPNVLSTRIVGSLITAFCLLSLAIGLLFMQAYDALINNQLWVLILLVVLVVLTLLVLLAICLQPRESYTHLFRVPLVPLVPALSIFINIYLMLQLDTMTWIRFGIWMIIGIPMFIACWCMYDIKNPEKRNPKRVDYAKALKTGTPPHLTIDKLNVNGGAKTENHNGANGTVLTTQNEHSVKSLDEIMNLNEVSEELIELKHPNGKVFYIEDTRSNTSTATLEGKDDAQKAAEATDDEKSVIAMLDDVLQGEDDGTPVTPMIPDYSRKFSVDSEMLPSVIESTTVATVHTSSDSSENEELEVLHEEQAQDSTGSSAANLNADFDAYTESRAIANRLVDDILTSEELFKALEQHRALTENLTAINAPQSPTLASPQTTPLPASESFKRTPSVASILTNASSVEDPMHSEKFKNKLSQIFMRPPGAMPQKLNNTKEAAEEEASEARPKLKHSKSESDVRQLVMKAIEGTGLSVDENEPKSNKEPLKDADGIPRPPKFDPVLYKTINNLRLTKDRPSLNKLLEEDTKPKVLERPAEAVQPELPFRQKLEAVLIRGPSHRTQKRPEVQIRPPRAKSLGPALLESESVTAERQTKTKSFGAKSESNLSGVLPPVEAINSIRKSLKHVTNGAVELS